MGVRVCKNCTDFKKDKEGCYCDIRYVIKNGKRTKRRVTPNKKGCKAFLDNYLYDTENKQGGE